MSETDQKLEDDVLRRMLATPPLPHKSKIPERKRKRPLAESKNR